MQTIRDHRIVRPIDNPNFAMIDLEFDSVGGAQSLLAAVQQVWQRVGGTLINDPHWRICEVVETQELPATTTPPRRHPRWPGGALAS
jgi:hypothetical protein